MLDRRQLLAGVAGSLLGALALPRRGAAQSPAVVALTDRLSLVTSGGTNVLALSTADGLVLVDSGAPQLSEPLMASLRQLSPGGRVRTVFNTHWHPENTGANDALRQAGATIVAHENTRLWMATPTWIPAEDRYRPARPQAAHPTKAFCVDGIDERRGRAHRLRLPDRSAHERRHLRLFRESNVLAVGDVASPARDPELDYFTGAWVGGRVDAMDRLVELSDHRTRIVPGSGPVMSRADLQSRARHDEDHLRPHRRSRTRGRRAPRTCSRRAS